MLPIPDLATRLALMREDHGVYCAAADNLRITSWCSLATVTEIVITGRFLTHDGTIVDISERHVPNTNRTIATAIAPLGEGWLLSVRAAPNGAPQPAQVFVRLELVRGLSGQITPLKVLAQGSCGAVQPLVWPGGLVVTSVEGPGALRSITGTNPAAGAQISETVPTGARWRVLSLQANVVTDGNVGTRRPMLVLDDGAAAYHTAVSSATVVASSPLLMTWARGTPFTLDLSGNGQPAAFPTLEMLAGHRIRTSLVGGQAGDDWGAPQLLVEEWLEGAA